MKVELNGEQVDLKGARTPEGIAEVVRQRVIELGGDPTTMQSFSVDNKAPSDDPHIVTLMTSFNKAAQR